jgi:DNA-binding HxlR family transcriptional regulator
MSTTLETDSGGARRVALLADLFHLSWTVPVLAELAAGAAGGRVAPLQARLGVSRPSLRRTLDGLIERGLVRRNPGYGHPLRPELVPLPRGAALAPWCARVLAAAEALGVAEVARRKWSLAALAALKTGAERFSEVQEILAGVTARALAQTLQRLEAAELVERAVYDDRPPSVRYRLTPAGRRLAARALEVPLV